MNTKSLLLLAGLLGTSFLRAEHPVRPELELLITSPQVVNSNEAQYPGVWSFGKLMEDSYGEQLAPVVVRSWLLSFTIPEKVNGHLVPPRQLMISRVIKPWQEKDGFAGDNNLDWTPRMENAPFKLLAIVNRQDLALVKAPEVSDALKREINLERFQQEVLSSYGGSPGSGGSFGELRFVFSVMDQEGNPLRGGMTVILEYGAQSLLKPGERESLQHDLHENAKHWHALSASNQIDATYLKGLAGLTSKTTQIPDPRDVRLNNLPVNNLQALLAQCRAATGSRSGERLLRIRTNDHALGTGREFRQFDSRGNTLFPAALSSTPAPQFYVAGSPEQRALARRLDGKSGLAGVVQLTGGREVPVLAGRAFVEESEGPLPWDARGVNSDVRRHLSMNTCIGCHGGEVGEGFHIGPNPKFLPARISKFLADDSKKVKTRDAVSPRYYRQPGELARRMKLQEALLDDRVLSDRQFEKIRLDHDMAAH